jgi:hypothetical protein
MFADNAEFFLLRLCSYYKSHIGFILALEMTRYPTEGLRHGRMCRYDFSPKCRAPRIEASSLTSK